MRALLVVLVLLWGARTGAVETVSPKEYIENAFASCGAECAWHLHTSKGVRTGLAGGDIIEFLFGCKEGPLCIIRKNEGGESNLFQFAAKVVLLRKDALFRIEGDCESACVMFADIARTRVCLGTESRLGFHKWRHERGVRVRGLPALMIVRYDPDHSPDIQEMVDNILGGYPLNIAYIPSKDIKNIWVSCEHLFPAWFSLIPGQSLGGTKP